MVAGGLMLGIGILMMALVVGLPILLIIAVIAGTGSLLHRQNQPAAPSVKTGTSYPSASQPAQPAAAPARYCSHCGAGLQSDWKHCPQCGAPIGG